VKASAGFSLRCSATRSLACIPKNGSSDAVRRCGSMVHPRGSRCSTWRIGWGLTLERSTLRYGKRGVGQREQISRGS
jgi:hypothetical protein